MLESGWVRISQPEPEPSLRPRARDGIDNADIITNEGVAEPVLRLRFQPAFEVSARHEAAYVAVNEIPSGVHGFAAIASRDDGRPG
jgi:hypothetical protein